MTRPFASAAITACLWLLPMLEAAAQEDTAAGTDSVAPQAEAAPEIVNTIPVDSTEAAAPEPLVQEEEAAGPQEILVTAQRREESAQDVPISITVFDQKQLSEANITNSSDLATYTPSLAANTRFGNETATFAIRGFTQDLRTTASVAIYFAEVVAPRGQSVQTSGDGAGPGSFFDLQNVQVLKGPQGTLFGRNTTGGAVLLVPQRPTDEFTGYGELTGGDLDALRGQAVVNVPVSDSFRIRLGVDANQRDGYLDNYTGIGADDLANTKYVAARLSGVWDISDSLENYTILSHTSSKSNGQVAALFACNSSPLPTENLLYGLTGVACQDQLQRQEAAGNNGFYDVASTVRTAVSEIREQRVLNTTTWNINEAVTLKNIAAYSYLSTRSGSSVFGTQFSEPGTADNPQARANAREFTVGATIDHPSIPVTSQQTWVEELQVQGNSENERVVWQAGLYYENSRPAGVSGGRGINIIYCEFGSLEGDPSNFNCFDPGLGQLGGVIDQRYRVEYINQAVYAQTSIKLLENLGLTAGIRYTADETKGKGSRTRYTYVGTVAQAPIFSSLAPSAKSEAPTGVIEMDWKPVEDVMLYGKYVRGYRQGSINMAADPGINTWKPEKVDTYEIGAKTDLRWPLPGRFNVALFDNDLTNQQLQTGYIGTNTGATTAIFNAGKSRIRGAEVEAFFQLIESVTASVSYAYLDTKLVQQDDPTPRVAESGGTLAGLTATPIAVTGDSLPFAVDHTVVSSLNWRLPMEEDISFGATYVYTGKRRSAATGQTPFAILEPFSLVNLNANWSGMFGSSFDLAMFATNVLEEKYTTYVSGTFSTLGLEVRQVGQPRMVGARLRYNF